MAGRVLFHVQHLLGVGHLRRAETLAEAMASDSLEVTVAYGGIPIPEVPFRNARLAPLPAATIAGEDFSTLLDGNGAPVSDAWKARRRAALLDLYRSTEPDVVMIELFPFGRRQFRFELLPLLEAIAISRPKPAVVCSVRDILVASKKPGRDEEIVETLRRFFDGVLVHGDPSVIPFGATFGAAERISDLVRYTGYVASQAVRTPPVQGHGEVLVLAGGGAVGGPLLLAAMEARAQTPLADHVWRFLTGPNLPADTFARLAAAADSRTIVERFRPDFAERLSVTALSISQAGYNTTMDILSTGARAIVVPYEGKNETEQRLRAEILAQRGILTLVPAAELSPRKVAEAVGAAIAAPPPKIRLDLSGAATTARLVRNLATHRQVSAPR